MTKPEEALLRSALQEVGRAFKSGQLQSASLLIDRLLARYPENAAVLRAKAQLLFASGHPPNALHWLELALTVEPDNLESLNWAAYLALTQSRFSQAEAFARKYAVLAPENPRPYALLANALNHLGRVQEALEAINRSLELNPKDADSLLTRAGILTKALLPARAIDSYRKSLAFRPSIPAAIGLAEILVEESHPDQALDVLLPAIENVPEADRPHTLIARAYTQLNRPEEAAEHWRHARRYAPNQGMVVRAQASAETAIGRFGVAEQLLREAIDAGVSVPECFYLLTKARKMDSGDQPLVQRMCALAEKDGAPSPELSALHFGLGKSFDDLRDFELAMRHFDEANRIDFQLYPVRRSYEATEAEAAVTGQLAYFNREAVAAFSAKGSESKLPLFVIGMVRSGTTLTESILGSHSRVKPGGEQMFWTQNATEYYQQSESRLELDWPLLKKLTTDYLDLVDPKDQKIRYVIDKNPTNIQLADLLHCLFPSAKMIHLKRNPVDNLLSIWMTPFGAGVRCASDRQNLVSHYRNYIRVWGHLERILPEESFQTISYEDLTSRPNESITKMLAFLGLELEPGCFEPEKNERAVLTPSVFQVRRSINTDSQARWRNYQPWLGPFAELLDERN